MRRDLIPITPTHLTYRLYNSIPNLPLNRLHTSLRTKKLRLTEVYSEADQAANPKVRRAYRQQVDNYELDHYLTFDRLLDSAYTGPRFLTSPEAKQLVMDSWHFIAEQLNLRLYAMSVMSNHVHVLFEHRHDTPCILLAEVLRDHKKFIGTQLNRLHQTPGRRVWAEKEYTRMVRRGRFEQVLWYVLNNPVKAGMTEDAVNWFGNWWAPELYEGFIAPRQVA